MKLPRTFHLQGSNASSDDKIHPYYQLPPNALLTEKYDGESQFWSSDTFHLRSVSSTGDKRRSKAKALWASKRIYIPEDIGLFIEDLHNPHTISYQNETVRVIRAIRLSTQTFLSFKETQYIATDMELSTVSIIEEGLSSIPNLVEEKQALEVLLGRKIEGFVITPSDSFEYFQWSFLVAKYVSHDFSIRDIK